MRMLQVKTTGMDALQLFIENITHNLVNVKTNQTQEVLTEIISTNTEACSEAEGNIAS